MEYILEYADSEIWRPCPNFPKYQVSHLGNVKNEKGNLLKPYKDSQGYLNVGLYVDYETYHVDSRIKISVHRLVADAFLLKDTTRPLVDHIDRNRENNTISNLRRATHHENALNKKQSDKNGRS